MESEKIASGIFMVAGPDMSGPDDASAFIIDCGSELCMIDCGAGKSAGSIVENILEAGLEIRKLTALILTHCHVDHIGAVRFFKDNYGVKVIAHESDADAIETGDAKKTAANWYRMRLPEVTVDERLKGDRGSIEIGNTIVQWLHTPGHTPGSIVVFADRDSHRVLFGQDIHGPFHSDFDSDITLWAESMEKLIGLGADILCEGHFGIYSGRAAVEKYIRDYLDRYQG